MEPNPMKSILLTLSALLVLIVTSAEAGAQAPEPAAANTLSAQEKADGWRLLWDGRTATGWRSPKSEDFPAKSWTMKDGELTVVSIGNGEAQAGGDIITRERFSNFELVVDFKTTPA